MSVSVSIIVAAYNAEKYIEQCIQSLQEQQLKEIEILVVNDGATDGTGEILERLAKTDARIRLFHQTNKGVSAARNLGLEMATGEYIGFADADDWALENMFADMLQAMQENGAELAICNATNFDDKKQYGSRLRLQSGVVDFYNTKTEQIQKFMAFRYDNANWNKLYLNKIIKQNHLRFQESMTVWEDLLFNLSYLPFTNKAIILDENLYYYRFHPSSVMRAGKTDMIHELNLLFENYIQFADLRQLKNEKHIFRKLIVGTCYSSGIQWSIKKAKSASCSFFKRVELLSTDLKRIDPEIYQYQKPLLKGLKGFKENLLYFQRFSLLAYLLLIRTVEKK